MRWYYFKIVRNVDIRRYLRTNKFKTVLTADPRKVGGSKVTRTPNNNSISQHLPHIYQSHATLAPALHVTQAAHIDTALIRLVCCLEHPWLDLSLSYSCGVCVTLPPEWLATG